MAPSRLLPVLLAGTVGPGVAFPSLREQIPNGRRVRCPDGAIGCEPGAEVDCQPTSVCHGVGHASCYGGSLPLNVFGEAFKAEGSRWTQSLCEADSDGDGLTNGEELGDPCCQWRAGDDPSEYTRNFPATHPGVANSASEVAAYKRPECSETSVKRKGTAFNDFNDNEEQRSQEFVINNYTIPAAVTTYTWFAFNFDDASQDVFHVVFAEAIVDKKAFLHHFIIRGCHTKFAADKVGKQLRGEDTSLCDVEFGGWAPGGHIVNIPTYVGQPIGKNSGIVAFAVQVHYHNQDSVAGVVDSSGLRIWYTPTLRNTVAGTISTLQLSANPLMQVPADIGRFFLTRTCQLKITDDKGAPAEFHVVSNSFHAHLLGREMYAEAYFPDKKTWVDVGSLTKWHFDDQYDQDLSLRELTFRTGDVLQTTCVMDSRYMKSGVPIGLGSEDEMCWAVFKGYPPVNAKCEGPLWTGSLQAMESAAGLAFRHPPAVAKTVLDGSNLLQGGKFLRLNGDGNTCEDLGRDMCTQAAAAPASFCDADLGFVNRMLTGYTFPEVCCKTACDKTCPNHARCSGPPPIENKLEGLTTARTKPWCASEKKDVLDTSAAIAATTTASRCVFVMVFLVALLVR